MQEKPNLDFFVEKYSRQRGQASRQIEKIILGHDVGLNGYTTLQQAQVLCDALGLTNNSNLLDVGCGCGWPGLYIAQKSGCRLNSTDIPF
ncbi:MAG: SAM-dependent methyltransferase [bacterium]